MDHCANLTADRRLGEEWEEKFCRVAARFGKSFTAHQIGRTASAQAVNWSNGQYNGYTLPDITIWSAPGQHHEIKHKNPFVLDEHGPCYGLEVYRFNALLWFANETGQSVYYTIHNHDLSGGRNGKINKPEHWFTAGIHELKGQHVLRIRTASWLNGQKKRVPTYYWPTNLWHPLAHALVKPERIMADIEF